MQSRKLNNNVRARTAQPKNALEGGRRQASYCPEVAIRISLPQWKKVWVTGGGREVGAPEYHTNYHNSPLLHAWRGRLVTSPEKGHPQDKWN